MKQFLNKLLIVLFFLCWNFFVSSQETFASQTTVTVANVNNQEWYDIEIMQCGENILIPVKQIADILEIPLKINHSTKELTYKDFTISKNTVFQNKQKLSYAKYLQKGMMEEVKDEIFCEASVLTKVFDTKIQIDKKDLSIFILSDRGLPQEKQDFEKKKESPFRTYSDIKRPEEKPDFTLDTIQFDNSMMSDSAALIYKTVTNKTSMFNNSGRLKLKGNLCKGAWEADLAGNNYKGELFSFSGMNFKYSKKFGKKYYEFGKVSGFNNDDYQLGTQILGIQAYNFDPKTRILQDLDGEVAKTSLVNVYLNDELQTTLNTYDGHYSLKNVLFDKNKIQKLELKELKEDKTEESILTKTFPKYQNEGFTLEKNEQKYSGYAGISGFNDRLFANNGYLYQMNTKKFTAGFRQEYGLKEGFMSDTKILYDRILSIPQENIWAQNYYNNNSLLTMGTFKNPNTLEGATICNTLNYRLNDNWKLKSNFALSASKDRLQPMENLFGYSVSLDSIYSKKDLQLDFGLYNQSPDFYLASSQFGFISDRLGARIGGNYHYKDWNTSFRYNKYFSNTQKKYDSGLINFDELNFNLSGRIKNIALMRYNFSGRRGENNLGENLSYYHDFNLSKYFSKGILLELGRQQSVYSNKFYEIDLSQNNFSSDYNTNYVKAGFNLPKNKGYLELAHEQVDCDLSSVKNNYNIMKINYTFPEMKRFLLSLGAGYKYQGNDNGLNYNATLGYRTKSGMIVSLGYRYETNGGYMFDNMYIPTSQRHSINFTINDTFALMPSGLKSIGQTEDTKGFIEVVAYLDKNNNGIYDKGDIGVKNVPIKLSFQDDIVYTDRHGKIPVATAEKGVYMINVEMEKLDGNLSIKRGEKQRQMVLIQPKQQTQVAFKMTSSVGNIRGNLKIVDDFGRIKPVKDFIVVLNDETGKEIAYSTVDKNGDYYFSGIEPGKYNISLDENFIREYNLTTFEDKGVLKVEIPYVYKEFIDLENMNLVYKSF